MGDDAHAWLTSLRLCISETVAMRHPHPMEHIARMLVDPSFQESLGLPTAEYVRRHNLEERLKALRVPYENSKKGRVDLTLKRKDFLESCLAALPTDVKVRPGPLRVGVLAVWFGDGF